jgi:hypothetical protein
MITVLVRSAPGPSSATGASPPPPDPKTLSRIVAISAVAAVCWNLPANVTVPVPTAVGVVLPLPCHVQGQGGNEGTKCRTRSWESQTVIGKRPLRPGNHRFQVTDVVRRDVWRGRIHRGTQGYLSERNSTS